MIILKATTESLQLTSSSTANLDYSLSFVDITTTLFALSTNEGKSPIGTVTTKPIVTLDICGVLTGYAELTHDILNDIHCQSRNVSRWLRSISTRNKFISFKSKIEFY